MLWLRTPVEDLQTGKTVLVRGICPLQPALADGLIRAIVADGEFGNEGARVMACRKTRTGSWIGLSPAPEVLDDSAHPSLSGHENEIVLGAREILKSIGSDHEFDVTLSTRRGPDGFGNEPEASVFLMLKNRNSRSLASGGLMLDSAFNLVPGVRMLETSAARFYYTMGVQPLADGDIGIDGDFSMSIDADFLSISYAVEETMLELASERVSGVWLHTVRLTVPLVDQVEGGPAPWASASPEDMVRSAWSRSRCKEAFPGLAAGSAKIIGAALANESLADRMVIAVDPTSIQSSSPF
ncbi:hypothetical protein [Sphingosinicella sp. BN140058]|uniref:hypothetical protein n=1 Tax=Sphingosinicella sp. BN140058 TaxID=1892855 RepID=UPI00101311A4|nr:hypothetical protein [Sphingosinicella sp. BN140058]QAY80477.1 hypothetical protein ETR14_27960 [Sphingosinicella sp. BN140058]